MKGVIELNWRFIFILLFFLIAAGVILAFTIMFGEQIKNSLSSLSFIEGLTNFFERMKQ
ncbi:MAG: hypothetical protein NTW30_01595 [Candidatus Aenigmarchaeota archaeon]|nr:hypothetical protein [Candidatus Aenigmarchaeota archaeon]